MKKVLLVGLGIVIGALSAKKIDKTIKKYRLVIKIERRDENDEC